MFTLLTTKNCVVLFKYSIVLYSTHTQIHANLRLYYLLVHMQSNQALTALEPIYTTENPNQPIQLYNGSMEITQGDKV